ncbi:unnamed protein product [Arctogadus glacialis]
MNLDSRLGAATLFLTAFDWTVRFRKGYNHEMVGHLHLQAMDDSLKGKNREGLLDSPDSGLPPSPSPPFCSLSPALVPGCCSAPVRSHQDQDLYSQDPYTQEHKEGKLLPSPSLEDMSVQAGWVSGFVGIGATTELKLKAGSTLREMCSTYQIRPERQWDEGCLLLED